MNCCSAGGPQGVATTRFTSLALRLLDRVYNTADCALRIGTLCLTWCSRRCPRVFALSITIFLISHCGIPRNYSSAQTLPTGDLQSPPLYFGDNESIGVDTTLRVFSGGYVGNSFAVRSGGTIVVDGGIVGENLRVDAGGAFDFRGGAIGDQYVTLNGSRLHILGGEFQIDGIYVEGLDQPGVTVGSLVLQADSVLSGILSDGTPFMVRGENLRGGVVIESTVLPAIGPSDIVVAPGDRSPLGIRAGQALRAEPGVELSRSFTAGPQSQLDMQLASVARNLDIVSATFTASGAVIGDFFDAKVGSTVNTLDTSIGRYASIGQGSKVTVTGGSIGDYLRVFGGSTITIHGAHVGGNVGPVTKVDSGATVNLFSGSVRNPIDLISEDTTLNVYGGDVESIEGVGTVNLYGGTLGVAKSVFNDFEFDGNLNVHGGTIGDDLLVGGALNMTAGSIGRELDLAAQASLQGGFIESINRLSGVLDVTGGKVGSISRANGRLNLTGGVVGSITYADVGSIRITGGVLSRLPASTISNNVWIYGGEFEIDGVPVPGLEGIGQSVSTLIEGGSRITGVLIDGTPFFYQLTPSGARQLRLFRREVSEVGPPSILVDHQYELQGVRSSQTLTLEPGGVLGESFRAGKGSRVVVRGGEVGADFLAFASVIEIEDGRVGEGFQACAGSNIAVSGGRFGRGFTVNEGATAVIAGGSFGRDFTAHEGSVVTLVGGEFRLDGIPVEIAGAIGEDVPLNVPYGSILTGTLSDGAPFTRGAFEDGALLLRAAELPTANATVTVSSPSDIPGLREGQSMTVTEGGELDEYFAVSWGGRLHLNGGKIRGGLFAVGAEVTVSDGQIGDRPDEYSFQLGRGATLNQSGGEITGALEVQGGGSAILTGGSIDEVYVRTGGALHALDSASVRTLNVNGGAEVALSGGTIDRVIVSGGGAVLIDGGAVDWLTLSGYTVSPAGVRISGGDVQRASLGSYGDLTIEGGGIPHLLADNSSLLTLIGREFSLDGEPIATLSPGNSVTISERVGTLSGILADGTPFSTEFEMHSVGVAPRFRISKYATLTLSLVAIPTPNASVSVLACMYLALAFSRPNRAMLGPRVRHSRIV